MTDLTRRNLSDMLVSDEERKVIELLRETPYGIIEIHQEESKSVRVVKRESIKL